MAITSNTGMSRWSLRRHVHNLAAVLARQRRKADPLTGPAHRTRGETRGGLSSGSEARLLLSLRLRRRNARRLALFRAGLLHLGAGDDPGSVHEV